MIALDLAATTLVVLVGIVISVAVCWLATSFAVRRAGTMSRKMHTSVHSGRRARRGG